MYLFHMKQQVTIRSLIKEFSIRDIEKQLILHYLNAHNMNFTQSSYLMDYLNGFAAPNELSESDGLFTNGYGIYPNEQNFNNLFSIDPITLVENFDVVQKILNSSIMHYYVKKTSVSIDGGYPCYQKNFIERFTIPQLSEEEIIFLRNADSRKTIDTFLMEKYQINIPDPYLC